MPRQDCHGPEATQWAMSLITAAHYDLDDYGEILQQQPAGGVSALVALALTGLTEYGIAQGLTPEQTIHGFAIAAEAHVN